MKILEEVATADVELEAPDMKTTVEYLFNKVSPLEKTVTLQQELIKDQIQTIRAQNETVVRLKKEIDRVSDTVKQLDYGVQLNGYFIKRHDIEFQMLNRTYPVLQTTIDQNAKESCAFSMAYSQTDKISRYNYLRFSQNLTDTCHSYDPRTGLFSAPWKGLYVFHLVVTMEGANDYLEASLKHNGQRSLAKLRAWDSDRGDQSSVTTVVHLEKGGKIGAFVDMCDCDPDHLPDGIYSVFSGYRLIK